MKEIPPDHSLHRLFRKALGFATCCTTSIDTSTKNILTSYLLRILLDFTHIENLYKIKDARGKRLYEIAEMLTAINDDSNRELYIRQHIGDYTLFILGLFPESLKNIKSEKKEYILYQVGKLFLPFSSVHDYYIENGRRSYLFVAEELLKKECKNEASLFFLLHKYFLECLSILSIVRAWCSTYPLFEKIKSIII